MSVRVVSRIRPLLEKERESDIIVRADTVDPSKPNTVVKIPNPKNESEEFSFTFNGVYDRATTQEELFTAEGKIFMLTNFGLDYLESCVDLSSCSVCQVSFPGIRCHNIRVWCHWYG
jgi:hypothetical protein